MAKKTSLVIILFLTYFTFIVSNVGFGEIKSITSSNSGLSSIDKKSSLSTNNIYQNTEVSLPVGPVPDWDFNITGIGISETVKLNLSYVIDLINQSQLTAYEETVVYKGNNQTIIGIDILELAQKCANAWYIGIMNVTAQDGFSVAFNAREIIYSLYNLISPDFKILLAFAVNGTYLPDSGWANKGALRMVVPNNDKYVYFNSFWVSNVTNLEITGRWACDFYVDAEYQFSMEANVPSTYADYNYTTIELMYKGDLHDFAGPTLSSIFEEMAIIMANVEEIMVESADDYMISLPFTEIPNTILALTIDGSYFGFNGGPYRLVGNNLPTFHWLKYVFGVYLFTTNVTTTPTSAIPGFAFCTTITAITIVSIMIIIIRKR